MTLPGPGANGRAGRRTKAVTVLWVIAILLAAILVTLLGAWRVIPRIIAVVVGIVLWLFLAAAAGHAFGGWGLGIVLGLPFVLAIGFGISEAAQGNVDMWGNSTDKPVGKKIISRRKIERNRARRAKAAEKCPKWENGRLVGRGDAP